MENPYDFIVIGSGFGGSVAALRLSEKGYRVLLLEQGKRFTDRDFPESNHQLKKYLWFPALGMYGIQKLSFFREASILSGTGLGGGSLVYANTLYLPPSSFFRQGKWAVFRDWERELQNSYEKAGRMLGRTQYQNPGPEDVLLRDVAEEMGRGESFQTVHVGVYLGNPEEETDPYFNGEGPRRKGCIECAGCMVGCRENAKNSLDKNYLYFAEKLGARFLTETKAEKLEFREGNWHVHTRSLSGKINRKREEFVSKGVVVAAGTLGTLDLLLKQKYRYKTLPDLSGRLGEELRTNSETLCAVSGAPVKLNNGLAITSVFHPDPHTHVEIVKYPDGSNLMKWFFTLAVGGAAHPFLRSLKLLAAIVRHPLRWIRALLNPKWSENKVIFLVMQSVDNAMRMIWKKGLFWGRMKIDNSGSKKVPAYIPVGQEVMNRYARRAGGISQNIILEVLFDRPTTAHILGGCPMGLSPEEGVIDPSFRVHGYPGLWVTDGAAVQGNLGVNPSLTITALAEYAMEQIKSNIIQHVHEQGRTLPTAEETAGIL